MTLNPTNSGELTQLLKKYQASTQKKFGQNFLIDFSVLTASLQAAAIQPTDTVVEIGAGAGALTQQLAARAQRVVVFEIDQSLRPLLQEVLADYQNIELHFEDFRHANLPELVQQRPYKVVANLPYNAGTHILGQLIQLPHPPTSITVLLQKEVAQKITATPPHATYLSNFISLYGAAKIIKIIKPGSFLPAPKVDSAILHIAGHSSQVDSQSKAAFSRFLHRGFASPRKKINKAFTLEELQQVEIDPNLRPENISLNQWRTLFQTIQQKTS